tara:strand:- start:188 stop:319 length:132 start_codon:yes stop_codon:yes gene_type:complete
LNHPALADPAQQSRHFQDALFHRGIAGLANNEMTSINPLTRPA